MAGGEGNRLRPITRYISKQLLPVFNKPMFYYPLSLLMLAGIREVLIISDPQNLKHYKNFLGSGEWLGMQLYFQAQEYPNGIAEAFIIAERFINSESCALTLGDNIMYGAGLGRSLKGFEDVQGAHIFAYEVSDPSSYGVVVLGEHNEVLEIEEKPKTPKSNLAIPGLYFYDNSVSEMAKSISPSERGELEITDLNKEYLKIGKLNVTKLPRGTAWLDAGTPTSLLEAANFVHLIESRQGIMIGAIEEIAFRNKWISESEYIQLIKANYNHDSCHFF